MPREASVRRVLFFIGGRRGCFLFYDGVVNVSLGCVMALVVVFYFCVLYMGYMGWHDLFTGGC